MFIPIPVLIVLGLVMLGLAAALLLTRRGDGGRDLMRPPASFGHIPDPVAPQALAGEAPPAPLQTGEAPDALITDVRLLLMQGRKIEAIKHVRDRQPGMGLKEAKDWVEAVERGAG